LRLWGPAKTSGRASRPSAAERPTSALFWHLQEAEQCLKHKNPAAAAFHLKRFGNAEITGPLQQRKHRLDAQMVGPEK
jgi:hypothetical protein